MLKVGIPKEIKPLEKRVGLTPAAVQTLCQDGAAVYVETQAGVASGYQDEDYSKVGAEILPDLGSVYAAAELIQKVKEPLFPEFSLIQGKHLIFSYLHLASPDNCDLVAVLQKNGATAVGYETVEKDGFYPLLAPMSEIAGTLASAYAALIQKLGLTSAARIGTTDLFSEFQRLATYYPHFPEMKMGPAVIFGGGVAGMTALQAALQFKADVAVVEKNPKRIEILKKIIPSVYTPETLPKSVLEKAEVLIGSVHAGGQRAAKVLPDLIFRDISLIKNKIIMDIAIDQGGNFPESRVTTYRNPVYFDSLGNLRFGVANMPSLCGRGASEALSKATLPYTRALAKDPAKAFEQYPELRRGINLAGGQIQLEAIRDAHRK